MDPSKSNPNPIHLQDQLEQYLQRLIGAATDHQIFLKIRPDYLGKGKLLHINL